MLGQSTRDKLTSSTWQRRFSFPQPTAIVTGRASNASRGFAAFLPALVFYFATTTWGQTTVDSAGRHVPQGYVPAPEQTRPNYLPPNLQNRLQLRRPAHLAAGAVQTDAAALPAPAERVLYSFEGPSPKGSLPNGGVIRDEDGNLYGTALEGGTGYADAGVVYKVSPRGGLSALYSFSGGADGSGPIGNLIRDRAGNLYGVTEGGGTGNAGVVYKLDPAGHQTVIYSFTGAADGNNPFGGLVRDVVGNLYGTTLFGGTAGAGVVFKLDPSGAETVLHAFTGGPDGAVPVGGLTLDSADNLYGTANSGGDSSACGGSGCGVVFKLDKSGNETALYTFTGGTDGANPFGSLALDSGGNVYGATNAGGDLSACGGSGCGVVFKLDKSGNETALYAFTGGVDGSTPYNGVVRDESGNLYGTASVGGDLSTCGGAGCGLVFKVSKSGKQTVLHTFEAGADGSGPFAGVILDEAENLYGTTQGGGPVNFGVVYTLDRTGKETMVYPFPSSLAGSTPYAGVIRGDDGDLYGTTFDGGADDVGVVYRLESSGDENLLYTFTGGADGGFPDSVIRDEAGNLYGTAESGGDLSGCNGRGCGVVYKLDPSGNQTVLYGFTGGADGSIPNGSLVRDEAGNLYGTAGGGAANWGVVYKVAPSGKETVLYTFSGGFFGLDGAFPNRGLVRDAAGNLYGTTTFGGTGTGASAGVLFRVDPSGHETVLHNFQCYDPNNGCQPHAGLISDAAGNLYGTTFFGGGPLDSGVVFKLDKSGNFTVLHMFTCGSEVPAPCGPDGGNPYDGVVRDAAGNLYGTTFSGGNTSRGIAYKLDPAGNEIVLHSFTGEADGAQPFAGLFLDAAGSLYGTAPYAGKNGGGVVLKIPSH
jgi:uncharacterized repeat protein (TIGR03803 family)